RVQVDALSIADDPRFGDPNPFVQAEQLDVSVKLLPLLHKSLEVDSLALRRPKVELIKNAQGTWNFSTIGAKSEPAQQKTSSSGQKFTIGRLTIEDGQV